MCLGYSAAARHTNEVSCCMGTTPVKDAACRTDSAYVPNPLRPTELLMTKITSARLMQLQCTTGLSRCAFDLL